MTDDPLKIRKEINRLAKELCRSLTAKRRAKVVNRITELRCALRLVCAGIAHFGAGANHSVVDAVKRGPSRIIAYSSSSRVAQTVGDIATGADRAPAIGRR
jgi:hypothetical protein